MTKSSAAEVTKSSATIVIITGLAMFSMFFGAGNVVFPLALGLEGQGGPLWAILGLLMSAVTVPFVGLIAMTLFDGDHKAFFSRMGPFVGFVLAVLIMGLIGPFGAIPRCITLSYATTHMFVSGLSPLYFSLASCLLIFLLTIRQNKILDILGYLLTPLLLVALFIIIAVTLIFSGALPPAKASPLHTFFEGLTTGYQTMDLLGAFFFSSVVILGLKNDLHITEKKQSTLLLKRSLQASALGAFLLGAVYIGFCYVAAYQSDRLQGISPEHLLAVIALNTLGSYGGIVVSTAVALACLTTAIALTAVFANFLLVDVCREKIGYPLALTLTLVVTFFISTLNFSGIVNMLAPILQVLYPGLIALAFFNIGHKLFGWQTVKLPVWAVTVVSLFVYLFA